MLLRKNWSLSTLNLSCSGWNSRVPMSKMRMTCTNFSPFPLPQGLQERERHIFQSTEGDNAKQQRCCQYYLLAQFFKVTIFQSATITHQKRRERKVFPWFWFQVEQNMQYNLAYKTHWARRRLRSHRNLWDLTPATATGLSAYLTFHLLCTCSL